MSYFEGMSRFFEPFTKGKNTGQNRKPTENEKAKMVYEPVTPELKATLSEAFKYFGLHENPTYGEVRIAYREKMRLYHPDRNQTSEAVREMEKIAEYYGLIEQLYKKNGNDTYEN